MANVHHSSRQLAFEGEIQISFNVLSPHYHST